MFKVRSSILRPQNTSEGRPLVAGSDGRVPHLICHFVGCQIRQEFDIIFCDSNSIVVFYVHKESATDRAYATPIGSTFEESSNFNPNKGFESQLQKSQNSMYRFKTI
jgi:hypothetical protein